MNASDTAFCITAVRLQILFLMNENGIICHDPQFKDPEVEDIIEEMQRSSVPDYVRLLVRQGFATLDVLERQIRSVDRRREERDFTIALADLPF